MMVTTGRFIVIDGIDGSGKRTQAEILQKLLLANGINTELFDFPRYGEKSATLVEEYLNGNLGTAKEVGPYRASIFYAVDRYAASKKLRELLDSGVYVISNRYVSASKGHQASFIDKTDEKKQFIDWLNDLEYNIFGIPKPDLTIYLNMPSTVAYGLVLKKEKRGYIEGRKQDILEEDKVHLGKAEQTYIEMTKGLDTFENWKVVNCHEKGKLLTIDTITERIVDTINQELHMTLTRNAK